MPTPAPTKYEVAKFPYGKYIWVPILQLVDFIPKGKHRGTVVIHLTTKKNSEFEATMLAVKHMASFLKEKKADHRLKEESLGITDYWRE